MIDAAAWGEVVGLLRTTAKAEIMPRFRKLRPDMVREKSSPSDLVTEADVAAEEVITRGLDRLFPGCLVVGEEACAADPALLGRLADADMAFVVDPIDGTANYVAGLPLFGVMAAAVVGGQVVAAAIHDPVGDTTATALRGGGAWMADAAGDRTRLRVAAPVAPAAMAGCVSWRYMREPMRSTVLRNMVGLGVSCDYRCAAHQYRMLAAGHADYMVFNRLLPWDHLPGWLLHQEAGGFSAQFDGAPLRPTIMTGGLICTADRASFDALSAVLFAT